MAKLLVADKEMIRNQFVQKVEKKLSDYLAKIGTQLQDNFPEAYEILIEIKDKQKEESKCDSIENTRAFLSSLNK